MNDRQRLEAILSVVCKYLPPDGISREQAMSEIISLVDPLPAQPEQEPVGEAHLMQEGFTHCIWSESVVPVGTKFYTSPPKRTWVGLTDEWVESAGARWVRDGYDLYAFARAIEAKLKELNT